MKNKKFQAAFGGWGTGADPYTLENIFKTGEERNYGSYSNPEADRLFEQGMRELDPEKRIAIYQRLSTLLYEDQPYTWLFHQNAFYGFNKSLRGYNFSPRGPYTFGPGFSAIWKPAL
jgi:peptide/nickel transport system substrate-binding protein